MFKSLWHCIVCLMKCGLAAFYCLKIDALPHMWLQFKTNPVKMISLLTPFKKKKKKEKVTEYQAPSRCCWCPGKLQGLLWKVMLLWNLNEQVWQDATSHVWPCSDRLDVQEGEMETDTRTKTEHPLKQGRGPWFHYFLYLRMFRKFL